VIETERDRGGRERERERERERCIFWSGHLLEKTNMVIGEVEAMAA
jgi:hypothetical protein